MLMNLRILSAALLTAAVAAFWVGPNTASASVVAISGGEAYTGTIKAESEGSISLTGSITVTCGKSTIEGAIESHGAEVPAAGKLSSLSFSECGSHTVTVVKPGSVELHATSEGNGTLTSTGAELTVLMHHAFLGTVHCIYTTTGTQLGTVTGTPTTQDNATLDIGPVAIDRVTTSFGCGSHSTLEGSYKLTTPANLIVTTEAGGVLSSTSGVISVEVGATQKIRVENKGNTTIKNLAAWVGDSSKGWLNGSGLCVGTTLGPVTKPTENFCDEVVECKAVTPDKENAFFFFAPPQHDSYALTEIKCIKK
jgi:hypothetical protein